MSPTGMSLVSLAGLLLAVATHASPPEPGIKRVPLAVARDRADLMHELYADTLEVVHERYFRREGAVLPARALEDVFESMERRSGVKAYWIAVNTPAMSVNHEPKTAFEKKAAEEIAGGKAEYSQVSDGYYQRAGAIPLHAGCVSCHLRFSAAGNKTPRFAGLVIAIPIEDRAGDRRK